MAHESNDPFVEISKYFPFASIVQLCHDDIEKLIIALVEEIETAVVYKDYNYCIRAAAHIRCIKYDYGIQYAAQYWAGISKIPKSKWSTDFFQASDVQAIIKNIYILENKQEEKGSKLKVTG